MENYDIFWLVWNQEGRNPVRKHLSKQAAIDEAERLAGLNPRQDFHVLQSIGSCKKNDIHWKKAENIEDFIPF